MKMKEKSCGTIPYTDKDKTIYYLLVKAKGNGYCGFPKGHVENDESEIETALRETFEETSVRVEVNKDFRRETVYKMRNGVEKTVVYYLASFQDQIPERNSGFEDFEYMLLPFEQAYRELTFDSAKQILKDANDFLKEGNFQV